uniref:Pectate lyase superfamily protein domain-containing protein n=1 Tax=Rhodococcus aetherivorans I24 TaxID=1036179 RepID=Q157F0_9NOCA|nr:hypothetical protein [Rhodococcus aetherivorans]ABG29063.1 hypothetical protein [Rhodococcus aetherivorans I24]
MGILDVPGITKAVADATYAPVQVTNERLSLLDPRIDADPTGTTTVDAALQAAFDMLATADGGTLFVPPGQYKLSRKPDGEAGQGYSAAIMRGVVEGVGAASHFYLDPATTAVQNPTRYYPIRIGKNLEGTTGPIVFRNVKLTGNNALIGGSSVMGFAARHDESSSSTVHSDDVTIEGCHIHDTAVAVGCTKQANANVVAYFNRGWRVLGNHIATTSNKAIELGHCDGGWALDNDIVDAFDGPQTIFYSVNTWFQRNRVRYRNTGINIAQGSQRFSVVDNDVECMSTAANGAAAQAFFLRTEPNAGTSPVIQSGVIRGNRFVNNQAHTIMRAVQFQTRTEVTAATFQNLLFVDNLIDGIFYFRDPTSPAKTTIQDVTLRGNRFTKAMDTVDQATCMVRRVRFDSNQFTLAQAINASDWQFRDDAFTGGLTLGASSSRIRGTVDAPSATVTDSGTTNAVTARALL